MHDGNDPADGAENIDNEIEIEFVDDESALKPAEEGSTQGLEVVEPLNQDEDAEPSILDEVERLKTELGHVRDVYLRKLAEFDNYRKRTERERYDLMQTASEDLVKELLPVLDNFERALEHGEEDDSGAFRQGVEMIARQLRDTLERKGVVEVNPIGQPFDPELHEAVQRVETTDHAPGIVVWVMLKGYTYAERLLRPAMVGVAVEPHGENDAGGSGS
jgi:molecular chaperone GrpE